MGKKKGREKGKGEGKGTGKGREKGREITKIARVPSCDVGSAVIGDYTVPQPCCQRRLSPWQNRSHCFRRARSLSRSLLSFSFHQLSSCFISYIYSHHCSSVSEAEMKRNCLRLAQSRFWLICYWILLRNERKLDSAGSEQISVDLLLNSNRKWKGIGVGWLRSRFWLICYWILIGNERKLPSPGSEQILVDLLLNSNRKWKEIGLGWLRADFGWFAIEF